MKIIEIKKSYIFLSFVVLLLIFAIAFNPEVYMQSTLNGILVWATAVVPALFPFFFLTKFLTQLGFVEQLARFFSPVTKKLFNVSGVSSYVFLMSVISGYPVGAKIISELYQNKVIKQTEAVRMCSFCSTSGPLFIIGTVGAEMFLCKGAGFIIFIAHILGAICNGLLFRNYKRKEKFFDIGSKTKNPEPIDSILSSTIYDSVISILLVGGYIALFFMIIDILSNFYILSFLSNAVGYVFGLLGIGADASVGFISGIVEVTRGCLDLSTSSASLPVLCVLACGVISWGGFSTHFQALTFLKKCNMKFSLYTLQKLCHAIFAMITCTILVLIFPLN